MSSDPIVEAAGEESAEPAGDLRQQMQREMQSTYGLRVVTVPGAFASLFRLDYDERLFQKNYRRPVLVSSCQAAGTKARLAQQAGRLRDLGFDLVAGNVGRILTVGAEPLIVMPHVAGEGFDAAERLAIVGGMAEGCRQAGCTLFDTHVMDPDAAATEGAPSAGAAPGAAAGMDVVAFAVGVCQYSRLILGRSAIEAGDDVIGVAGDGLHGVAFERVRQAALERQGLRLDSPVEDLGFTVADLLLAPAKLHAGPVLSVLRYYRRKRVVRGMAHVTGVGLRAALERSLPDGLGVRLNAGAWPVPPVYAVLEKWGIPRDEQWQAFGMGIGFALFVRPAFTQSIVRQLCRRGQQAWPIGSVVRGPGVVLE